MAIIKKTRVLKKQFISYARTNGEESFTVFINPEDRDVKYLKIKNELWIYFPDADDIMKISGHMLKQGMMGSDISYEELLEEENLKKNYSAGKLDDVIHEGQGCYKIELNAKVKNASYEKQVLTIDKETFVPVKIELYARGGRLLKIIKEQDIRKVNGRMIPHKIIFRDLRRKKSKTVLIFSKFSFDMPLKKNIFTRRNLKR